VAWGNRWKYIGHRGPCFHDFISDSLLLCSNLANTAVIQKNTRHSFNVHQTLQRSWRKNDINAATQRWYKRLKTKRTLNWIRKGTVRCVNKNAILSQICKSSISYSSHCRGLIPSILEYKKDLSVLSSVYEIVVEYAVKNVFKGSKIKSLWFLSSLCLLQRFLKCIIQGFHVKWVPCNHGMASSTAADGEDCLQIKRVSSNTMSKLKWIAKKGRFSSRGNEWVANS
jgi:hypothetical protein